MNIISRRVSCRDYDPAPVPQEQLVQIREAARLAPSACNQQNGGDSFGMWVLICWPAS